MYEGCQIIFELIVLFLITRGVWFKITPDVSSLSYYWSLGRVDSVEKLSTDYFDRWWFLA